MSVTVSFLGSAGVGSPIYVSSANPLPVTTSGTGTGDVNLAQVAGVATKTGNGTASGAQRVTLASDGTGVVGLNAGSAIVGKVGIDQTTPGTTNLVAAGQNGTWTVQPGNTPNTTPWLVTGVARASKGVQDTTITSSTGETTIVTADATHKLDLYGLVLANSSASATLVTIKDATSGTTRAVFYVPAGDTRGFMLPPDGGIPQATTNANWTATCGTSVASLYVTALYTVN